MTRHRIYHVPWQKTPPIATLAYEPLLPPPCRLMSPCHLHQYCSQAHSYHLNCMTMLFIWNDDARTIFLAHNPVVFKGLILLGKEETWPLIHRKGAQVPVLGAPVAENLTGTTWKTGRNSCNSCPCWEPEKSTSFPCTPQFFHGVFNTMFLLPFLRFVSTD